MCREDGWGAFPGISHGLGRVTGFWVVFCCLEGNPEGDLAELIEHVICWVRPVYCEVDQVIKTTAHKLICKGSVKVVCFPAPIIRI